MTVLNKFTAFWSKDRIIKKQAKKNKEIIYGARSMNKQLAYGFLGRGTFDWDLFSKKPRRSALQLERSMDRKSKGDYYYTKEAMHPGTWKVMFIGNDRKKGGRDDVGIADYTKKPPKLRTVKRNGLRYAHVNEQVKNIKKSLSDPQSAFRHEKDRLDWKRIKVSRRLRV